MNTDRDHETDYLLVFPAFSLHCIVCLAIFFRVTNYPLPGEICHILSLNVLPCLFTGRSVSLLVHGWVCDLVS